MSDLTLTVKDIRPLIPSQVVDGLAGGSFTVGDAVALGASSWVKADADAAPTASGLIGICVACGTRRTDGAVVANDKVSVVVFGRVSGWLNAVAGQAYYVSANAGKVASTAGTVTRFIANGESTNVIFINGVGLGLSA
jgi:hypothetical protein